MAIDTLPTEIIDHIFLSLQTVRSAISLSATCHRLYHALHTSKRLSILEQAAEAEFGPLDEAVQLVTQNSSQPAHTRRTAAMSEALLGQLIRVGRIAQAWEDVYPLRKWRNDRVTHRRLLTTSERRSLRQAMYRLWLFDRAFHNSQHVRTRRMLPAVMHDRALLLHNYDSIELGAMLDVHLVLRDIMANHICPSNGKIRARLRELGPSQINIHLNYPLTSGPFYGTASKYHAGINSALYPDPDIDGHGDDIGHYYIVEDMMKLDPEQILFLRNGRLSKLEIQQYVGEIGEWFINNGEVFSETLNFVVTQRGLDLEEMKDLVQDFDAGVVVDWP